MDYEKKYKEALERAKKLASDLPNGRNDRIYHIWDLESIFPELAKNDDERIRIGIISGMKALQEKGKYTCFANILMDKVFDWLEKQGEKDKLIKELGKYKVKYTQEVLSQYLEKQGDIER